MKIAIISDIHLGDTQSVMAFRDNMSKEIVLGSKYNEFIEKIRGKFNGAKLDYLVLLGDILDFSIASYYEAFEIGKFFFQHLKDDDITKEIIYLPGNHDYDLWHTIEYEINVTNRLKNGKLPKAFRHSIPAIIDDRKGAFTKGFTLHNVKAKTSTNKPKYAGLFLDYITEPKTPFNFVHPNIYLITDEESVLITHGQYLDAYWSILGKWSLEILNGDMNLQNTNKLNLKEMVAINFPLSTLNCSGLGQAGPLTGVIKKLEHELKDKYFVRLKTYFNRVDQELKNNFKGLSRLFLRAAFKLTTCETLKAMKKQKSARFREDFLKDKQVCERTRDFYNSTVLEIGELQRRYDINIPYPTLMIFGHTHRPIPMGSDKAPVLEMSQLPKGKKLTMVNTGGWLTKVNENNQSQFSGAEIFFYDTGAGISSVSIR
jgi:predicted phosphodiesterase